MSAQPEDPPIGRDNTQQRERRLRTTEFASTILLALATVLTTWSSYQASLWSGIQATNYNQANATRVEASRESNVAGQLAGLDIALFMAWIKASDAGDHQQEDFYRRRFRPEFRQAFEAWLATNPHTNPQAAATPFTFAGYTSEHLQRARELDDRATALFQAGHEANHHADTYVLGTVLLSTVLFFCGILQQFHDARVRYVLLGIAACLFVFGLSRIIVLPRA